jgi:hypothetical protein
MLMLLVTDNMIMSQELNGKDPVLLADPMIICCTSIDVSYTITEDCCINIVISNPYCWKTGVRFDSMNFKRRRSI